MRWEAVAGGRPTRMGTEWAPVRLALLRGGRPPPRSPGGRSRREGELRVERLPGGAVGRAGAVRSFWQVRVIAPVTVVLVIENVLFVFDLA